MKRLTLITLACVCIYALQAQSRADIRPIGLDLGTKDVSIRTLTKPNMEVIHAEDAITDTQLLAPLRFAYPVLVNFTLTNSGTWHTLDNGDKLWQLKVQIPDALSTHAYYDKFYLPEGAIFFVYSEETGQSKALTSEFLGSSFENPIKFATGLIYGETVVFEYWQPAEVQDSAIIEISSISYGYRYVNNPYESQNQSSNSYADNCYIDINCWEGRNWQKEKRAVVMIITPTGNCSGALINNANNDYIPYVLTARHCIPSSNDLSQWMFYWDYERSGCGSGTISEKETVGAVLVARHTDTDFALLRLTIDPLIVPNDFMPYYLGWDRSSSAASSGVGIHHPKSDPTKKISITSDIRSRPIFWTSFWRVKWDKGSTEKRSSGSPLLNSAGRVVGQLKGGSAGCDGGTLGFDGDNYGRFDISWDIGITSGYQLRAHLGGTTNPTILNGLAPGATLSASTNSLSWGVATPITFTVISKLPTSAINGYEWELTDGFTTSGTITTGVPSISLTHTGMATAKLRVRVVLSGNRKTDWVSYTNTPFGHPPTIIGPDEIVTVPGTFERMPLIQYEVSKLTPGATVSWQLSNGLTNCSPLNSNPICIQRNVGDGECRVTLLSAKVTFDDGGSTTFEKTIIIGYTPNVNLISSRRSVNVNDTVPWGKPECHFLDTLTYNGGPVNLAFNEEVVGEWKKLSPAHVSFYNSSASTYSGITSCPLFINSLPSSGWPRIEARLQNQCGWSLAKTIEYPRLRHCLGFGDPSPCPPCIKITYSPNPTTDEITIEFEQLPDTDEPVEYTVKLLDNLGNIPRQTRFRHRHRDGKPRPVKFNTYSLPPGTYFLHVEGAGELVREQIIVVP
ncbi:MAG: trypsin-like peptidase domain-containing protein [Bacteroidales bacterium]|jgi:hypothetical protein|nr:trypsin-like peptidase domain-containing protein [Bacteroidales bacterium]